MMATNEAPQADGFAAAGLGRYAITDDEVTT